MNKKAPPAVTNPSSFPNDHNQNFQHFSMDLSSLKDQVSSLTLYDLKAGVRKVQNGKHPPRTTAEAPADMPFLAVMNYTEMEAKVDIGGLFTQANLLIIISRSEKLPITSHGALHRR